MNSNPVANIIQTTTTEQLRINSATKIFFWPRDEIIQNTIEWMYYNKTTKGFHAGCFLVNVLMPSTLDGYHCVEINPNGNANSQFCSCIFFNKKITECSLHLNFIHDKSINIVNIVTVVSKWHKNAWLGSNFKFSCCFRLFTIFQNTFPDFVYVTFFLHVAVEV